jgi:hypothetical protein
MLSVILSGALLLSASAVQPVPSFREKHYRVDEVPEPIVVTGDIHLGDQWGISMHQTARLDKFANPVDKNNEGIPNELVHQTWWEIDDPQPGREVMLENQFGVQTWFVKDARYLVLPAAKNAGGPLPEGTGQHYKCYEAQGPIVDAQVTLLDQWGDMTGVLTVPRFFCNPVEKTFQGVLSPVVNDSLHLACYQLEPMMQLNTPFMAWDQFGDWNLTALLTEWVCVPSAKLQFISVESRTWGNVKKLFRD